LNNQFFLLFTAVFSFGGVFLLLLSLSQQQPAGRSASGV
jgi:hypothetical protein